MTENQVRQVEEIIKRVVNGKIDRLSDKLDNYITDDNRWKADALPVIKLGNNLMGFWKVTAWILGSVAGVFGLIKLAEYFRAK